MASIKKSLLNSAIVIVTILLLTTSSILVVGQTDPVRRGEEQFVESFIDYLSLNPDPHLNQAPNVVINGTSGEFNSSFHSSINATDPSYIELNWTHVHDTPLQFRTDEGISACADFVYFTQEIEWPYNEMPLDAELRFNISVSRNGDFETEDYGSWMYNVLAWLIDSSGNWTRIYDGNMPYADSFWERSSVLDNVEIEAAWRGMISNSTHPQEDPEDKLTLAMGLSPNSRFQSFQSSEPWRIYDGSVYARVSDVDIYVKMDLPPDPSTHMEPIFNNTWGMKINEIFPMAEGGAEDFVYDIATSGDGSVYVVGRTSTGYEYYSDTNNRYTSEILLKYDSELNLLWSRRNVDKSRGYDVEVHRGFVYTAGGIHNDGTDTERGNYDSYVTKWGPDGNRIWSAQWGNLHTQEAVGVAVGDDSSVYVFVCEFNWHDPRYMDVDWTVLLKYDAGGRLLWNKTLDPILYPPYGDIFVTHDRVILDYSGGFLSVRDLEGDEQWNMTIYGTMTCDSNHIYVTRWAPGIQIEKWSLDAVSIWNTTFSKQFVNGANEMIWGRELDLAPDGSIFLLTQEYYRQGYSLNMFNSDGSQNWTKSIGNQDWPYPGGYLPVMTISSWGIAYFTMSIEYDFHTFAFRLGEYSLPKPGPSLPVLLVLGSGGVVAAMGVLVWTYRKRSL